MKIAPIQAEFSARKIPTILLHTGQHYDENMSKVFFEDLGMREPDIHLGVGSGSHATQTAKVMVEFEKVCNEYQPSMVVVVGDVNSTLACTIVSAKLLIPCAHVEAGLRSFDREMPEEINRILTDSIANLLLTPSVDGDENLRDEGVVEDRIFRVGNIMIDSLFENVKKAESSNIHTDLKLDSEYALFTLHRPSNVDDKENFATKHSIKQTAKGIDGFNPNVVSVQGTFEANRFSSTGLKGYNIDGFEQFLNGYDSKGKLLVVDTDSCRQARYNVKDILDMDDQVMKALILNNALRQLFSRCPSVLSHIAIKLALSDGTNYMNINGLFEAFGIETISEFNNESLNNLSEEYSKDVLENYNGSGKTIYTDAQKDEFSKNIKEMVYKLNGIFPGFIGLNNTFCLRRVS